MKKLRTSIPSRIFDILLYCFVYLAARLMKKMRNLGLNRYPLCKRALFNVGIFPIRDHYYEPLFHPRHITRSLSLDRMLPGIDWNHDGQLSLLAEFRWGKELIDIPTSKVEELSFHLNNNAFESGDAEFWYNLIRLKKPRRIIEVGSGYSTLMAINALNKNKEENPDYECRHICIEPYEMPWLEKTPVSVIRKKVEDVNIDVFRDLKENDVLFIDSSHMIRPQGDVLFEFLQLLPSLRAGVIVHVHDIFSPKDYPQQWVLDEVCFWNEQYLLEAFLTSNRDWKIIGALNYLHHNRYEKLKEHCIFLSPEREPGSFYIQKIK